MVDIVKAFAAGLSFPEYVSDLRVHRDAFRDHYERLAEIVEELRSDPPLAGIRVLAISEDWCPDCVFNIPIVARFAEASDPSTLRIVRRPAWRALADAFPGRGGTSRIPTFVFIDHTDQVVGHWSERCASSQQWFETFTKEHPMPTLDIKDGIPAPPLMDWMKLRISSERDRFYAGVWREVLAEIRAVIT